LTGAVYSPETGLALYGDRRRRAYAADFVGAFRIRSIRSIYPDGVREAALAHKYKNETTAAIFFGAF
jgi:hypothetical protein